MLKLPYVFTNSRSVLNLAHWKNIIKNLGAEKIKKIVKLQWHRMRISRKHVSTSLNVLSEVRITRVCNMYSLLHFSEAVNKVTTCNKWSVRKLVCKQRCIWSAKKVLHHFSLFWIYSKTFSTKICYRKANSFLLIMIVKK